MDKCVHVQSQGFLRQMCGTPLRRADGRTLR